MTCCATGSIYPKPQEYPIVVKLLLCTVIGHCTHKRLLQYFRTVLYTLPCRFVMLALIYNPIWHYWHSHVQVYPSQVTHSSSPLVGLFHCMNLMLVGSSSALFGGVGLLYTNLFRASYRVYTGCFILLCCVETKEAFEWMRDLLQTTKVYRN